MDKIIPKYTPIIIVDGRTNGVKRMQVQSRYVNDPTYVVFETTAGDSFSLTPADAKEVIYAVEDGKVVYIKHTRSILDEILHLGDIVTGLSEYEK
jgi:hypothetical protein